jgi:hypothetical protein
VNRVSVRLLIIIIGLVCLVGLPNAPALAIEASVTVNPILKEVTVTPVNKTISLSEKKIRFSANATFTNAPDEDITDRATWSSSDETVATIDSTGLATLLTTGNTTIRAEWSNKTGSTTLTVSASSGGGNNGGSGGGGGSSGTVNLNEYTDKDGMFLVDTIAESPDGLVSLQFLKGTVGKNRVGQRLRFVTFKEITDHPEIPENRELVCPVYDIGYGGTTFEGPVYLIFNYEDDDILAGFDERKLVIAAWLDGEWIDLEGCQVDPVRNTITVLIDHLTIFAVMAGNNPANIKVDFMEITPAEAIIGNTVTINVDLQNTGDISGDYTVRLKMPPMVSQQKTVSLAGGESRTVSFTVMALDNGDYTVDVNGISGSFRVIEPKPKPQGTVAEVTELPIPASFTISGLSVTPKEVNRYEQVTVSAVVSNTGGNRGNYTLLFEVDGRKEVVKVVSLSSGESETISFITAKDTLGEHTVAINGQTGRFTVKSQVLLTDPTETPEEPPSHSRWLVVIVFVSLLFLTGVLFVLYKKLG